MLVVIRWWSLWCKAVLPTKVLLPVVHHCGMPPAVAFRCVAHFCSFALLTAPYLHRDAWIAERFAIITGQSDSSVAPVLPKICSRTLMGSTHL